jgi:hypothetical protein
MREKPLSLMEGRIVGLDSAILIAEAREKLRVEWGGSLPEEEWCGTACDIVTELILPFCDTRSLLNFCFIELKYHSRLSVHRWIL